MQLLEQHFDAAFAAPDGIKKLRELILTLAMQGKLVEQDPGDQPASELLKEIESARLKGYKLKDANASEVDSMLRKLSRLNDLGKSAALPESWVEIHLIQACEYLVDCHNKTAPYEPNGIPIIRTTNIRGRQIRFPEMRYVSDATYEYWSRRCPPKPGDIIFTREAPMGEAAIIPDGLTCCLGQRTMLVRPMRQHIDTKFILMAITEPNLLERAASNAIGSTVKHLRVGDVEELIIPLPPLAEQRRIVARIDELMARCDELEALRAAREQKRVDVHTAALNALLGAQEPAAFAEAWKFLAHHFGDLHSVPRNVAELRKAVLQLAVMGKLVEQDPNDPPTSELLREIQEEKNRLIVAGKIRAPKPLLPVTPEEMPYPVPAGWEWVRLGDLALSSDSGWSPQCLPQAREGEAWGVLKVSAVSWGEFRPAENKALPDGLEIRPEAEVKPGDFLISRANTEELVARSVIVNETPAHLMLSDKIVRFVLSDLINKRFVNICNGASYARFYYASNASGTSSSMKNVGREVMSNLPLPLPPLPEQRRIVAKIDQLLSLIHI